MSQKDILYVRLIEVSFAETPLPALAVHFSGACAHRCSGCHSKALWEIQKEDAITLGYFLETLEKRIGESQGLLRSVVLLGTDSISKTIAGAPFVTWARRNGIQSVIYTGYHLRSAIKMYTYPDLFVCGPYVKGEWSDNKRFYQITTREGTERYREISKEQYF
jgi:pyruvate-formate lyase-activating enzyme